MITRISITNDSRRRSGFTFAELMLVIVILVLMTTFSGVYYMGTYKKASLRSAARKLLLTGKYARMRAIEDGQTCQLHLDNSRGQFYLVASTYDPASRTKKQAIVSNPYCRKTMLKTGIEFEYMNVEPAMGESEVGWNDENSIRFYPNGCCDSAVVQMGNGRHSMTAVFSSAYAKIKIHEGRADALETGMQVVDLDAVD